jgi:hypothetical protein
MLLYLTLPLDRTNEQLGKRVDVFGHGELLAADEAQTGFKAQTAQFRHADKEVFSKCKRLPFR